jgi:uncharacterized membrane protein YhaH (DUF805 family)
MRAAYFVRPIGQMFNFKGTTGRAEYFSYAVMSFLVASFVTLTVIASVIFAGINWSVFIPSGMLNERGYLYDPMDTTTMSFGLIAFWIISQVPMLALTVRRLRDQYANVAVYTWFFIPFFGPVVLFAYGFVPTFHDYQVTLPDGTVVWRSQQLTERHIRNTMIGVGVAAAGYRVIAGAADGLRLEGGPKTRVNRNMSAFKADGTINNRTSTLGGRKAHMRAGRPVEASRNKYTL